MDTIHFRKLLLNNKPKYSAFRISCKVKHTTMNSALSNAPTLNPITLVIKSIFGIRLCTDIVSVSVARVVADVSCFRCVVGISVRDTSLCVEQLQLASPFTIDHCCKFLFEFRISQIE